jgi:hypothetical protein
MQRIMSFEDLKKFFEDGFEEIKEDALLKAFFIRRGWEQVGTANSRHRWLLTDWTGSSQYDALVAMQREFFWKELNPQWRWEKSDEA